VPTIHFKDCSIQGDLAQAVLDLEQQIGDIAKELIEQIQSIPVDTSLIPSGHDILDQEILKSPNPLTQDQVSNNTGIPKSEPTITDDEDRLAELGLILCKGVLYLADKSSNIENYRRLYFSVGSNMDTFFSILNSGNPFVVVQTRLHVKSLTYKPGGWNLTEVRKIFNNPAIENIYSAGDEKTYAVVPEFLSYNESVDAISRKTSIPENQILSQVFWLGQVDQNSQTVAELIRLGITGNELTATLFGERLLETIPSAADSVRGAAAISTGKAIAQLQLLNQRFAKLDSFSKESLKSDAKVSISEANYDWFLNAKIARFWPTVLSRTQDITDFLSRNTKSDLDYLFTEKRKVLGIDFQATNKEILDRLKQVRNISSGSSTVSSLLVNDLTLLVDPTIDVSNQKLIQNFCAVGQLQSKLPVKVDQVQTALACLKQSLVYPHQPETPSPTPLAGYASYDSPASIINRRMDFGVTFNVDKILEQLTKVANDLSHPIKITVNAIVSVMRTLKQSIDNVYNIFLPQVEKLLAQIEGFLSRFMAFHGTTSLDSSVLKCSLGLDIQVTLPILDQLETFLTLLKVAIGSALAKINQAVSNLLKKLLCMPINFLNSYITGVSSSLPAFCQTSKITLPSEIEVLLIELRDIFQAQQLNTVAFNRDLVKMGATVQALPLKLDQFRTSLLCDSPAASNFFKASKFIL
jgi:hypothetical protein